MGNKLKKLVSEIEEVIKIEMEKFTVLAKENKKLQGEILKNYNQMGALLKTLEPVESLVRMKNPDLCPLFDELIKNFTIKEDIGKQ